MKIELPNWLFNFRRITSSNCVRVYGEPLKDKLEISSFLDWDSIRKELKQFNVGSKEQYRANRRPNWPSAPHTVYKEWRSWPHFLGKREIKFLSFEECMADVQKNKIKSISDYLKRKKSTWPYQPNDAYKAKWQGWPHFLGKKKVDFLSFEELIKQLKKHKIDNIRDYRLNRRPEWPYEPHEIYKGKWQGWLTLRLLTFEECRKEVLKCNFKSMEEYKRKRKPNWAFNPSVYYKKEWKGKKHFLGLKDKFLSFEECKKEVKKYKFTSHKHYSKSRKPNWPSSPKFVYKKQWKGWSDFLGRQDIEFLPFEQCRKEVARLGFKSKSEYQKYKKINNKLNWPAVPDVYYKNQKKWKGWLHFLNKQTIHVSNFLSFEDCKKEVAKCNIKTNEEYRKKRKPNWPSNPNVVYKEWKNWPDFFGKQKVSFISFEECRKQVLKCKFKTNKEYVKNRKPNWPSTPSYTYKKQWKGWLHFLGKESTSTKLCLSKKCL